MDRTFWICPNECRFNTPYDLIGGRFACKKCGYWCVPAQDSPNLTAEETPVVPYSFTFEVR